MPDSYNRDGNGDTNLKIRYIVKTRCDSKSVATLRFTSKVVPGT